MDSDSLEGTITIPKIQTDFTPKTKITIKDQIMEFIKNNGASSQKQIFNGISCESLGNMAVELRTLVDRNYLCEINCPSCESCKKYEEVKKLNCL